MNYLFFSEHLHRQQMLAKHRRVERLFAEAEVIRRSIEGNRGVV